MLVTGARAGDIIQRERKKTGSVCTFKHQPSHLTRSGLQSNLPAIYLSPLVQTCLDMSEDISNDSFNNLSTVCLERNQSLSFWEGQETLYPSINTNIQMIFYSSNFPQNNPCVVGLKSLINITNRHFQVVNER